MKAKRESADFDKVQAGLKARGFQEKDVTIPSGKAMVLGLSARSRSSSFWAHCIAFFSWNERIY